MFNQFKKAMLCSISMHGGYGGSSPGKKPLASNPNWKDDYANMKTKDTKQNIKHFT